MSWIIGCIGDTKDDRNKTISQLHPPPLFTFKTSLLYLAAGGIKETLHWPSPAKNAIAMWLVAGTGIVSTGHDRFLEDQEWEACFDEPAQFSSIGGHFIALRWNGESLECHNDQIGLRTLYFATSHQCTYFSTRLDWVARLSGFQEIDFHNFGSRWLCVNQFSHVSPIANIQKLGPGGRAVLHSSSTTAESKAWQTDFTALKTENPLEVLQSLLSLGKDRDFSLGLSGGMDSRVLLSLLLSTPALRFSAYTLGESLNPDVRVATMIAQREGMPFHHFNEPLPSVEETLLSGMEYLAQTNLCEPLLPAFLRFRSFKQMYKSNQLLIDGAFGELSRRQYLKRLFIRGRTALLSGNPRKILPFLRIHRSAFFQRDIAHQMEAGALNDIERVWNEMPAIGTIGMENFLDLLTIRTRVPNYGVDAQAMLDSQVLNVMPFIQPAYLHAVLALPVEERRNGKFFKQIIRTYRPTLIKYPLVKGPTTYPFFLPTFPAMLWTKAKSALGLRYVDPSSNALLLSMRSAVLDMVTSKDVKECAVYDYPLISSIVTRYYNGQRHLQNDVHWWLSFELWRKNLSVQSMNRIQ